MKYKPLAPLRFFILLALIFLTPLSTSSQYVDLFSRSSIEEIDSLLAVCSVRECQPDSAILINKTALEKSQAIGYLNGITNSYGNMAAISLRRGFYEEALWYCKEAKPSASQDKRALAYLYGIMGWIYAEKGDYNESLPYLFQSASLNEQYPTRSMGSNYNNIASVIVSMPEEFLLQNKDNAISYINLSIKYATEKKDSGLLATSLSTLGNLYTKLGAYDLGFKMLDSAFAIASSVQPVHFRRYAMSNSEIMLTVILAKTDAYLRRKEPQKAIVEMLKGREFKDVSVYLRSSAAIVLSKAYRQAGAYAKGETELLDLADFIREAGLRFHLIEVYEQLVELYKAKKEFSRALYYNEQLVSIREEITGQETTNLLNLLSVKYQTAVKDNEILSQKTLLLKQSERIGSQRNFITTIVIAGSFGLILLWLLFLNEKKKRRLKEEQMRIIEKEKELDQLKAIMDAQEKERGRLSRELHDGIGGMLASIKLTAGKIVEQADPPMYERMNHLTKMLNETIIEVRRTSHNLMPEILSKHSLIEAVVIFCDNVSLNGPDVEVKVYGDWSDTDTNAQLIFYRIIQELVQNSVKHADASQIIIQLLRQGSKGSIMFEDDGNGFSPGGIHHGIGFQNLEYRIQALNGKLDISSVPGRGTTINIEFDLNNILN